MDNRLIPTFSDSISFLYLECGNIDGYHNSVSFTQGAETFPIPIYSLNTLLLGPGTTITHEAIKRIAKSKCTVSWVGQDCVRFYSNSIGNSDTKYLNKQIEVWTSESSRIETAGMMFHKRFPDDDLNNMDVDQIRGLEGIRMRQYYAKTAQEYGIDWTGRKYEKGNSDMINSILSCANACLYGISMAAITALGCSPAIGFIHTGNCMSFVYDVADMYKLSHIFPLVFSLTLKVKDKSDIERATRLECRQMFKDARLLDKIIPDVKEVLYGRTSL